jgi:acylglycerol lipase
MNATKTPLIGQRSFKLMTAAFAPDDTPKALAILVHGYGEHAGRYKHVIEALVGYGYAVYTLDHRGHGESQGARGLVERWEYFVDDLRLLSQQARAAHPALPMVMIGQSMGGLIAFHYAVRYQHELAGLVLTSPALRSDVAPHLRRVARVLGTVLPWLPITPLSSGPESALSRDPRIQELWDADALTYKQKMKAGMGYQLIRAINTAHQHLSDLTLPLLIMQGTADTIVNPQGAQLLYESARSSDKTIKYWSGCRHEIFNEIERDEVIAFMLQWLDARVAPPVPQGAAVVA